MSTKETKESEDLEQELAFFRNQTKVLREKNRDLRNALLISEAEQESKEPKETTQESISDIRKIIADSKKQITEKLQRFKETIDEESPSKDGSTTAPPTAGAEGKSGKVGEGAPSAPQYSAKMDNVAQSSTDGMNTSAEVESLAHQVAYLKKEIDRNEVFLEQSEMVNSRLRQLLVEHNIDLSEITKAISQASKTATSSTAITKEETASTGKESKHHEAKTTPSPKKDEKVEELEPAISKAFIDFEDKIGGQISDDDIKMEILEFRELLMNMIPHSRVFYEMQVEYRKWKRGISSVKGLQNAIKEWKKTIASMME